MKYRIYFFWLLASLLSGINPSEASSPAHTGLFAAADTAETAYNNPAGMVRLGETSKTLQGIVAYSFIEFDIDKGLTSVDGGDPDKDHTPIVIPAFYYIKPFWEDWWFGFSINVPSGFGSNYGNDWAGRYYTDNYTLVYVGLTPSIAYRINEHWSVGGSLNLTYTYSESAVRINNPGPGQPDGKLEYDADAIGVTGTLSLLYQHNDHTRLGLSYTGEASADLEGDLSLNRLSPVLEGAIGRLDGTEIEVENILPQRFQLGLYHEFDSGRYMTMDGLWIDFSEFGTGDITVENNRVVTPKGIYDDIWGITLGLGFPKDDRTTWKVGMLYLSEAVDDDKRTLSLRLDRIWGLGVGVSKQLDDSRMDVNLNVYNLGDAPVDTGAGNPMRGRVVGENSSPFAIAVDLCLHW